MSEKEEIYRGAEGVVYRKKGYVEPKKRESNIDTTQEKPKTRIIFWVA